MKKNKKITTNIAKVATLTLLGVNTFAAPTLQSFANSRIKAAVNNPNIGINNGQLVDLDYGKLSDVMANHPQAIVNKNTNNPLIPQGAVMDPSTGIITQTKQSASKPNDTKYHQGTISSYIIDKLQKIDLNIDSTARINGHEIKTANDVLLYLKQQDPQKYKDLVLSDISITKVPVAAVAAGSQQHYAKNPLNIEPNFQIVAGHKIETTVVEDLNNPSIWTSQGYVETAKTTLTFPDTANINNNMGAVSLYNGYVDLLNTQQPNLNLQHLDFDYAKTASSQDKIAFDKIIKDNQDKIDKFDQGKMDEINKIIADNQAHVKAYNDNITQIMHDHLKSLSQLQRLDPNDPQSWSAVIAHNKPIITQFNQSMKDLMDRYNSWLDKNNHDNGVNLAFTKLTLNDLQDEVKINNIMRSNQAIINKFNQDEQTKANQAHQFINSNQNVPTNWHVVSTNQYNVNHVEKIIVNNDPNLQKQPNETDQAWKDRLLKLGYSVHTQFITPSQSYYDYSQSTLDPSDIKENFQLVIPSHGVYIYTFLTKNIYQRNSVDLSQIPETVLKSTQQDILNYLNSHKPVNHQDWTAKIDSTPGHTPQIYWQSSAKSIAEVMKVDAYNPQHPGLINKINADGKTDRGGIYVSRNGTNLSFKMQHAGAQANFVLTDAFYDVDASGSINYRSEIHQPKIVTLNGLSNEPNGIERFQISAQNGNIGQWITSYVGRNNAQISVTNTQISVMAGNHAGNQQSEITLQTNTSSQLQYKYDVVRGSQNNERNVSAGYSGTSQQTSIKPQDLAKDILILDKLQREIAPNSAKIMNSIWPTQSDPYVINQMLPLDGPIISHVPTLVQLDGLKTPTIATVQKVVPAIEYKRVLIEAKQVIAQNGLVRISAPIAVYNWIKQSIIVNYDIPVVIIDEATKQELTSYNHLPNSHSDSNVGTNYPKLNQHVDGNNDYIITREAVYNKVAKRWEILAKTIKRNLVVEVDDKLGRQLNIENKDLKGILEIRQVQGSVKVNWAPNQEISKYLSVSIDPNTLKLTFSKITSSQVVSVEAFNNRYTIIDINSYINNNREQTTTTVHGDVIAIR